MTMTRPWKAPAMRPTLARLNSAASGLRFCGMIEEPVVNLSESLMKPNCGVIQITISSASRDKCTAADRRRSQGLEREIAVRDAVERVGHRPVEAEHFGGPVAIDRERRAGQRRRPERALVEPLARIGEPAAVARQHLDVGQQMMAEGDRLRRLQMREPRHHHGCMRLGLARQRHLQLRKPSVEGIDGIAHPQPEVGRHLIVTRPRRVEPLARIPDQSRQPALHVQMHIFQRSAERKRPALDLGGDLIESLGDFTCVRLGDDTGLRQHCGVRLRAPDVLRRQCLVEADRGVYLLHDLGRGLGEASAPHLVGGFLGQGLALRIWGWQQRKGQAMHDTGKTRSEAGPFTYAVAAALTFAVGFAAVYVTLGRPDNKVQQAPAQIQPAPALKELPKGPGANPLSAGEMAGFVFKKTPEDLPEFGFVDGDGKSRTIKDWAGKVVLLNLWATWCAPCRKEMPSLDRLQKALGSDRFEVMALAIDRTGADSAKKFLDSIKIENLKLYVDASARSGSTLKAPGLPTTILVGKDGREIGRLVGPAEWDGPDANRLIEAALR